MFIRSLVHSFIHLVRSFHSFLCPFHFSRFITLTVLSQSYEPSSQYAAYVRHLPQPQSGVGGSHDSFVRPSIHPSTHPLIHSFIHSFIHSIIHSFNYSIIHSFIHSFILSSIHSFIYPFIHSSIHSFFHPFIHSFIHSFIHPFIHSSIHSFIHSLLSCSIKLCVSPVNPMNLASSMLSTSVISPSLSLASVEAMTRSHLNLTHQMDPSEFIISFTL